MGLPALLDDYFFLAPLIQQRLLDQVGDLAVDVVETADQVYKADQRSLVAMVMWAGDRVPEVESGRASNGASQILFQRWAVMLCVANASAVKDARQLRAGTYLSKVHKALAGWVPGGCVHPFRRANAPLRPDIAPQKAIYPMGFEVQLNL